MVPIRRSTAALVACLSRCPADGGLALINRARGAEWLLLRADLIGELGSAWLKAIHPWRLIYALRTRAHGGFADPAQSDRADVLREAAMTHDLVELEAPHDLTPDVLAVVPPARRLVTWRVPAQSGPALAKRLHWLTSFEAAAYQLVVACGCRADALAPLDLLAAAGRRDVVAYAAGEAGLWSRVLSPFLGSPFVFGGLEDDTDAGEPSVARLVDDFGLPDPGPVRMTFGIAGDAVSQSLSPRLHNACYRALGVSAIFLPFPVDVFGPFWDEMVAGQALKRLGLPLQGLTVSSPNKEMALQAVPAVAPAAHRAWSANLVYRRGGHWVADTTDPAGVTETLFRRGIAVAGRRAAVAGCGGSGRAIASALARLGAHVVLSNRGRIRGELASRRLGLPLVELTALKAEDFDLIVNATPVGRASADLPFACDRLKAGTVIVDLVYAPQPTALAAVATACGARVISGHEVLLVQATRQFAKMTGKAIPVALMADQIELPSGVCCPPDLGTTQRAEAAHLVGASPYPMAAQ